MPDLAERVGKVRLLLETLHDPYPTTRPTMRPEPGPAASRYVPCEACHRHGWARTRRGVVLCLVCDGAGWRRRRSDDEAWDAYIGLPVTEAVQLPVEAAHRPRDLDAGEESPYGWERLQAAYEARGSYREVRRCLGLLARERPWRHHLVCVVVVENQPRQLSRWDELEVDLGVVWITLRMRSIRVPPWLLEHERIERNEEIQALANIGLTPSQIALQIGLEKEAVKRQLRRLKQRSNRRMISLSGAPQSGAKPERMGAACA